MSDPPTYTQKESRQNRVFKSVGGVFVLFCFNSTECWEKGREFSFAGLLKKKNERDAVEKGTSS